MKRMSLGKTIYFLSRLPKIPRANALAMERPKEVAAFSATFSNMDFSFLVVVLRVVVVDFLVEVEVVGELRRISSCKVSPSGTYSSPRAAVHLSSLRCADDYASKGSSPQSHARYRD